MWQSNAGGDWDIDGARVTPAGTVFDGGAVVSRRGDQLYPGLCCGGDNVLLSYQAWTDTAGGKTYNADRIWGKLKPHSGIEESIEPLSASSKSVPTIVRGVLFLPKMGTVPSGTVPIFASLLDATGRRVLELHTGANDVRSLAPGVYFARLSAGGMFTTRKLVLTE